MELHHKIVEVLKQEFPDLKVPEIQEGFAVALTVSVERMVAEAGDQVKRLQFEYCSETGNFTYFPIAPGMSSAKGHSTTEAEFQHLLQWAKSTGTVNVRASVLFFGKPITV
jgi:hypothetical protein